MTDQYLRTITPTIDIYIKLAQYPILADRIRERMRQELFERGIVNAEQFEREVEQLSLGSQRREGLANPFAEEDSASWQLRKERVRDYHTDAYFANNLGSARLDQLIEEVLSNRSPASEDIALNFNPEIAPWEVLFRQGEAYEKLPPQEREEHEHHLQEIKVVLIKRLMSDQLPYIGIARQVLTVRDLHQIYQSLIGTGKIGGKAAGMILAWRILQPLEYGLGHSLIEIPDSYFIGTDVLYEFFLQNRLEHFMNQKYRPVHEIREEYPRIVERFRAAALPDYVVSQLREVLDSLQGIPIIVRSSSLLEDNFGYSFAGKYNSYFCANQGTTEENLACVVDAILRIYASTINPDALLYRKKHNLIDYDERMAILIQRVSGRFHGRYFFPDAAGLAFSENHFRWSPEIRAEDGFLRIVTGLGTRAVERVSTDYPRLIPLSHPTLRIESEPEAQRTFSQRWMAVVDRETNSRETIPVSEGLAADFPALHLVGSLEVSPGEFAPIPSGHELRPEEEMIVTFDGLCRDERFINMMRDILDRLEKMYGEAVNLEFALEYAAPPAAAEPADERMAAHPTLRLTILECRPLHRRELRAVSQSLPDIAEDDIVFSIPCLLPSAQIEGVRYLVYVDPEHFYALERAEERQAVAQSIARLNDRLPLGEFAIIGPGRWGDTTSHLSVPVTYSDICNCRFLVELTPPYSPAPELAFGTDFYEEMVETNITIIGIQPGTPNSYLHWELLKDASNLVSAYLTENDLPESIIRVIDLEQSRGARLSVVIDDAADQATAYLSAAASQ